MYEPYQHDTMLFVVLFLLPSTMEVDDLGLPRKESGLPTLSFDCWRVGVRAASRAVSGLRQPLVKEFKIQSLVRRAQGNSRLRQGCGSKLHTSNLDTGLDSRVSWRSPVLPPVGFFFSTVLFWYSFQNPTGVDPQKPHPNVTKWPTSDRFPYSPGCLGREVPTCAVQGGESVCFLHLLRSMVYFPLS